MNYGIPYKGSKNRIAERIIEHLPSATHFYDVFGGGGAITHCAILSGKYKYVHYNEYDPLVYKAFVMACNNEFKDENRFISRDEFEKLKDVDPYVAICFSFGNDLKTYCYSRDKEELKKRNHFVNKDKIRLQHKETLNRLNSLCINTETLSFTNCSYDDLDFECDSVIYCDPPYKDTNTYRTNFNHEKFYKWCKKQKNIYISEYNMPNDFKILKTIDKVCSLSLTNNTKTCEKLFTNNSQSITNALEW